MMRDIFNALTLPDDRPITSLCIVEEIPGCPPNYAVVKKTHDQDIDADLCKDGFFKRITRYLCHSKTEGFFGYVVESILILGEKEARPAGYTVLEQTSDTNQRAFRKKQLCYKAVPRHMATQTITDIIILSRSKVAPEGFTLFGEMNGLSICYKQGTGVATGGPQAVPTSINPLPYNIDPNNARGSISSTGSGGGIYPGLPEGARLHHPTRRAPGPPVSALPYPNPNYNYQAQSSSSNEIYDTAQSSLSGVPFIMNKKYIEMDSGSVDDPAPPVTKGKQQIDDEFYYSFTLEQDVLQRST